ncbi:MAG: ABC transporter ATP-binding protein [Panacagrimonas sp.]
MTESAWLRVSGLRKSFGSRAVLDDVGFEIGQGRTLAVIGSSGCGKTTLLRVLAGLEREDEGRILVNGRAVQSQAARDRQTLYLYQEPLLFPHLDVFENIAFGLRLRGQAELQIRQAVAALLVELELEGYERRAVETLSGGQRQRVAFGRALIVQPALLLLDEPFGSLDPDTRSTMQLLFKRVAHEHRMTAVFVTHDLKEALRMGDEFGLLDAGRLRHFPDRGAFCAEPASGVARERAFWQIL